MTLPSQNRFQIKNLSNNLSRGPVGPIISAGMGLCAYWPLSGQRITLVSKPLSDSKSVQWSVKGACRPYYQGLGTLCVLTIEGLTNNFGLYKPVPALLPMTVPPQNRSVFRFIIGSIARKGGRLALLSWDGNFVRIGPWRVNEKLWSIKIT
jgi:hypothetical protein